LDLAAPVSNANHRSVTRLAKPARRRPATLPVSSSSSSDSSSTASSSDSDDDSVASSNHVDRSLVRDYLQQVGVGKKVLHENVYSSLKTLVGHQSYLQFWKSRPCFADPMLHKREFNEGCVLAMMLDNITDPLASQVGPVVVAIEIASRRLLGLFYVLHEGDWEDATALLPLTTYSGIQSQLLVAVRDQRRLNDKHTIAKKSLTKPANNKYPRNSYTNSYSNSNRNRNSSRSTQSSSTNNPQAPPLPAAQRQQTVGGATRQ
jgi:hypothetical protein